MSVTQEPLAPPVGNDDVDDVKMTSAGPHLSARSRDDDVTSHSVTRVSPGLIQPFPFLEMI